jgi:hypothetical protein
LSTVAISGSEETRLESGRGVTVLRYADLVLLVLALPIFLLAGWPMLGYAVAVAAWLVQRALQVVSDRAALAKLKEGNRRHAMGLVGAATLGRLWIVTLSVLLVGGLAEREDGLAAALLTAGLVTAYLVGMGFARLFDPDPERPGR